MVLKQMEFKTNLLYKYLQILSNLELLCILSWSREWNTAICCGIWFSTFSKGSRSYYSPGIVFNKEQFTPTLARLPVKIHGKH